MNSKISKPTKEFHSLNRENANAWDRLVSCSDSELRPVPDFNLVAPIYSLLERCVYGNAMQYSRAVYSNELKSKSNILIMGEGPGKFVQHLSTILNGANVHIVEKSARMRRQICKVIDQPHVTATKVNYYIYDDIKAVSASEAGCFDAVVTHFYLDMFGGGQLFEQVKILSGNVTKDAVWLYSDFCIDSGLPISYQIRNRFLLWFMYQFFGIVSGLDCQKLEDPKYHQRLMGWEITDENKFNFDFIKARILKRRYEPVD